MQTTRQSIPALRAALLAGLLASSSTLWSETLYVSDQFEVPLRTGETTDHAILRMLPSGTAVELVETDKEKGYSRVRTASGVEGYMLSRYLMPEAAARDQLAELRGRLSSASDEQGGLSRKVDELGQQLNAAQRTITELTSERDQAAAELDHVKSVSQKSLELDERNKQLVQQVAAGEQRIRELSADNDSLRKHTSRDWFLAGGGLVFFSMLLGVALTRVRWRKRSRYSDF
jgi:SH3 domain protein